MIKKYFFCAFLLFSQSFLLFGQLKVSFISRQIPPSKDLSVHLFLAGDFNAEPSEPIYSTIRSHPRFGLESAYRSAIQDDAEEAQEPPYTTWKVRGEGECCHTIDYVFYSRQHLAVDQVLPFPTGEQIGPDRVPSFQYPSDHFSLVVDFDLVSTDANGQANVILNKLLCV